MDQDVKMLNLQPVLYLSTCFLWFIRIQAWFQNVPSYGMSKKFLVWFRNVQSYGISKVLGLVDKFSMRTALWFRCSMEPYSSRAPTAPTKVTTENDDGGRNLINKQFLRKLCFYRGTNLESTACIVFDDWYVDVLSLIHTCFGLILKQFLRKLCFIEEQISPRQSWTLPWFDPAERICTITYWVTYTELAKDWIQYWLPYFLF